MTYFAFCIHNHQPAGNFEDVLEDAYEDSYRPFLEILSKHPSIKLTLHTTGFLIDWIMEKHPEYIKLLKSMVSSAQVEIMGGGYYEPILSVLSEDDRIAQIKMMSDKIEELFGKRPRGMWLAERVWEPTLPTTINRSGIEYIVVDDYHFIKSGLTREQLGGYFVTEDQGNILKVFPGSERLRYLIPFKPADELIDHLKGLKGYLQGGNAAIYGDDGEKFGVWPGTRKWVFEEGWLKDFFLKVEAAAAEGWLKPVTFSEYIDRVGPQGRVYLPTTSYMEMGEWSLPAKASREFAELREGLKNTEGGAAIERFMQGGVWRNFFSKYPESNWMHKRMLQVSRQIEERRKARPSDEMISSASRFLYEGQCNDAYWHGVFGGLYMPHLRTKVYENLIRAENLLSEDLVSTKDSVTVESTDIDADGYDETVVRTSELNLFFSPADGGTLVELDYRPRAVNLSNTLARRYEGYHHKLTERDEAEGGEGTKSIHDVVKVKEEGLERYLHYDNSRRTSFRDHFLSPSETLDAFYANEHKELGDFHSGAYAQEATDTGVRLTRGGVAGGARLNVSKEFRAVAPGEFTVDYTVSRDQGPGAAPEEEIMLAVELNMILPCCDGPVCQYLTNPVALAGPESGLGSTGELTGTTKIGLVDNLTDAAVTIRTDRPARLWRFPVHTVSLSEAGFEKIFQGSCMLFCFPLDIGTEPMKLRFSVSVTPAL